MRRNHELNFATTGIRTWDFVIRRRECEPLGHPDAFIHFRSVLFCFPSYCFFLEIPVFNAKSVDPDKKRSGASYLGLIFFFLFAWSTLDITKIKS